MGLLSGFMYDGRIVGGAICLSWFELSDIPHSSVFLHCRLDTKLNENFLAHATLPMVSGIHWMWSNQLGEHSISVLSERGIGFTTMQSLIHGQSHVLAFRLL